jgi:acetolactate synthase-1/3 small subunit
VLVDNEPGILARVVGCSRAAATTSRASPWPETDAKENLSRITIVTAERPW